MRNKSLSLVKKYRAAEDALTKYKGEFLWPGRVVVVRCQRYDGPGTVVTDNQCPVDQVAVVLENGSVWRCPIEHVTPATQVKVFRVKKGVKTFPNQPH